MKNPENCSCGACKPTLDRRTFLKASALAGAGWSFLQWPVMAGPFTRKDFERLVPADKKLTAEWVKSLFDRGEPTVYRGVDLEKIGMPVGGICAGQLYLGGDGKLWHWDIFNRHIRTGAEHYAKPMQPTAVLAQGFALRVRQGDIKRDRKLDRSDWKDVTFNGEYPIGTVNYRDPDCPVEVRLEAFSPFVPLNIEDSSLPVTVLEFTISNKQDAAVEVELAGWLENAVCLQSGKVWPGMRKNRVSRSHELLLLECSATEPPKGAEPIRPDIVFEDFEAETYANWTVTGTAFGPGPVEMARIPDYQGRVGGKGKRVVNTHATAPGADVGARDSGTGTLTSRDFTIERRYISFLQGGGAHAGKTCVNLVIDGKAVLSSTGKSDNRMQLVTWDVRRFDGKTARIEIIDQEKGPWGNVGVDQIVFTDTPQGVAKALAEEADFGTMCLGLLGPDPKADFSEPDVPGSPDPDKLFPAARESQAGADSAAKPFGEKLIGTLGRRLALKATGSAKVTFIVAWHMPNLKLRLLPEGRDYARRFPSAGAVTQYVSKNFARLSGETRLWHDTWYDSTLPYWFLDRTFLNTSILASSTCYLLKDGRFYGWEGVGCCEGTCGHVWQYAHAVGRLFPDLERRTREKVDLGIALQPNGAIHFRGEHNNIPAIDAQAGTILRILREHQMSADDAFLKRNWSNTKRAVEWLIVQDGNGDGLLEGGQHNTLDTDWYGPVAWLSGLYLAALEAARVMAVEVGDTAFADRCGAILKGGSQNLVERLFDGDYFINKPDPKKPETINSGSGCEIDQVFGQSWAFQVGLPRVLPKKETLSALKSLWRYNFTPDVGPYREAYKAGRWYAMAGEAGLLMCSFPRTDWDYDQAKGKGPDWAAGYFNECMNGFEYQVAGHMLWEGMVMEGLAITRAVHDRYHASRRNPWNEVECGDHYARSMASYGVFLAACGFEYHGPKQQLGFAPRLNPNDFKAAFTGAEGWGSYAQKQEAGAWRAQVVLRWGRLKVASISMEVPDGTRATVSLGQRNLPAAVSRDGKRVLVTLAKPVELTAGETLEVRLSGA